MTDGTRGADGARGRQPAKSAVNKGGRPRLEMSEEDFKKLISMARIHCTAEECAAVLGVSPDTVDRRLKERGFAGFADFYSRYTAEGRASIRRMQWKAAEAGNVSALIWLGKQLLGQRDFSRQELSGPEGGPIETTTSHVPYQEAVLAALRRKHAPPT